MSFKRMKRIACACKNENSHENAVFVLNDIFIREYKFDSIVRYNTFQPVFCNLYVCICTGANKQEKVQITCGMIWFSLFSSVTV